MNMPHAHDRTLKQQLPCSSREPPGSAPREPVDSSPRSSSSTTTSMGSSSNNSSRRSNSSHSSVCSSVALAQDPLPALCFQQQQAPAEYADDAEEEGEAASSDYATRLSGPHSRTTNLRADDAADPVQQPGADSAAAAATAPVLAAAAAAAAPGHGDPPCSSSTPCSMSMGSSAPATATTTATSLPPAHASHHQRCMDAPTPAPAPAPAPRARPASTLLAVHPALPAAMQRSSWSLEDFSVIKKLQTGYASRVYQATCNRSQQQVALKVYRLSVLPDLNKHQVYREVRLHSRLDHPGIIQLYAAFREKDKVVLVQQYADGGDLHTFLRKYQNVLPERRAVQMVVRPLLHVLAYLHSQDIVHRDIKLENILLMGDQRLKLADFGLAVCTREERPVTRAGTLDMMAPEVVRCPHKVFPEENKHRADKQYGASVDVWAVGVLATELVGGESPFKAATPLDTADRILHSEPNLPDAERCSEAARDLMQWSLSKEPAQRPSLEQLLDHPWLRMYPSRTPFKRSVSLHAYDLAPRSCTNSASAVSQEQRREPALAPALSHADAMPARGGHLRTSLPSEDARRALLLQGQAVVEVVVEAGGPRSPAAVGASRRQELGAGTAAAEQQQQQQPRALVQQCTLPRSARERCVRGPEDGGGSGAGDEPHPAPQPPQPPQQQAEEENSCGGSAGSGSGGGAPEARSRVLRTSVSMGQARAGGRERRAGLLYSPERSKEAVQSPLEAVHEPDQQFKERIKSVILRLSLSKQGGEGGGSTGGSGGGSTGCSEEGGRDALCRSLPRPAAPRDAAEVPAAAAPRCRALGAVPPRAPGELRAPGGGPGCDVEVSCEVQVVAAVAGVTGAPWDCKPYCGGGGGTGWAVRKEWQYSRPARPDALLLASKRSGGATYL